MGFGEFAFLPGQSCAEQTAARMPQERKDEDYSPAALSGVVVFIVVLMALGGLLLLVIGQPPTWNSAGFTVLALWLLSAVRNAVAPPSC
jgi:hypothetical protein